MVILRDLKSTEDYERLDEVDPADIETLWTVRPSRGQQAIVSALGRKCFAQEVPEHVVLCSPFRPPRGRPWYVLIALTDEEFDNEEAWHDEQETWAGRMHGQNQSSRAAGRRWFRINQDNGERTRKLGNNGVIGRNEGLW
jgi:hypothetical protein